MLSSYPDRLHSSFDRLDFSTCGNLTFEKTGYPSFPEIWHWAYEALPQAGKTCALLFVKRCQTKIAVAAAFFSVNRFSFLRNRVMLLEKVLANALQLT